MKIYRKLFVMVMTVLIISLTTSVMVSAKDVSLGSHFASPAEVASMEKVIALFEQLNPDIKVELICPEHETYKSSIRMWLTSKDSSPDVFSWFAGVRSIDFVEAGLTMDITDMWESKGYDDRFAPGWKSLIAYKGEIFMVPITHDWWAMYYRKSIFDHVGVAIPKTWDEFLDVCATLKAGGVTPITIGTKWLWTAAAYFDYLVTRTAGPDFYFGLMAGEESYADIRVARAFEYWKELVDKGYFLEDHAAYDYAEAVTPMLRGEAAMYCMGNWWLDVVPDEVEPDMDFFSFPIIDPSVPVVEKACLEGFIGAANAPHPEEALVLLDFLASTEGQKKFASEFGRPSPNLNIPLESYSPEVQKGIALVASADALMQYYDSDTKPEMAEAGMNAFVEFMLNPDKAEEILIRLQEDAKEIFGG